MDLARFEQDRLALFARHGFQGESRWVTDRQGRRTYMIARGDGAPPTVLIHGGLSDATEWSLLAGRLPGEVIVPDRPGCGLSYRIDYRRVPDFRQAAQDWMVDLINGIGAESVDLVANSMGGFFAVAYALAHPDRVRGLVLVGAAAGLHGEVPPFLRLWANPVTGPLIARMKITDAEALRRIYARLLVVHPERVPLDLLQTAAAAVAIPGADRAASSMLRSFVTLRGVMPKLLLRDEMAGLRVPTLFLWGDSDAFAPAIRGQEVAAKMPDARFEVLAHTGHLPQIDHPEALASAINGFLGGSGVPGSVDVPAWRSAIEVLTVDPGEAVTARAG
jgi:2-hydroxymuconate-semialdehyde hydrolase